MNDDLFRLLDEPAEDEVARVLRSSLRDEPSTASIARAATALGLGSATVMTMTHAAGSSLASSAVKAGLYTGAQATPVSASAVAIGSTTANGVAVLAAKWLVCGVLAGALGTTSLLRLNASPTKTAAEAPRAARAPVARAPGATAAIPDAPSRSAIGPSGIEAARPAQPPVVRRTLPRENPSAAPTLPSATPAPVGTSLDAEIALLDETRRALNAGDAVGALAALARVEREIEKPALGAETTLLKARALVLGGAREEARELARKTLAARGTEGYACRLAKIADLRALGCPQ